MSTPTQTTQAVSVFKTSDKQVEKSAAEKTVDGFRNVALKLGIGTQGAEGCEDNALSDGTYRFNLVTRNRIILEAAFRGSWIVGRVIDCVAEDMTKVGVIPNTNKGAENLQDLKVHTSRLQIWQRLKDTVAWSRLYGGAIAVMQIEGQDPKTPLDLETIGEGQFKGLVVYDRWQLNPSMIEVITSGPDMGLPLFYDIVLGGNVDNAAKQAPTGQVRVHHSRCIRMEGIRLPYFQAITEMMWGESVLERMWDKLIEFDTATASAAGLVTRANLRTVGINGLREILGAGGEAEEALVSMLDYVRKFQSSEGLTLIDKEDEMTSTSYSFAGLSDMVIQFGQQVSGSSEIPLVRLFGQSPAGLSATGESDMRNYYDSINAKQESQLRNPLETLLRVLWRSCFGEAAPSDLTFTFTPLWQMSATDKATIGTNNTASIVNAHQEGLLDTATAMKELKQASAETGLFTHITDEEIEEAENDEPPMPGEAPEGEDPKEVVKKATGDSAWKKIRSWLSRDKKPAKVKRVLTADQIAIRKWVKQK